MTDSNPKPAKLPPAIRRVEDDDGNPRALACSRCDVECSVHFEGDVLKAFVEEHRLCVVCDHHYLSAKHTHCDSCGEPRQTESELGALYRRAAEEDKAKDDEIAHLKQCIRASYYWARDKQYWQQARDMLANQMHAMGELGQPPKGEVVLVGKLKLTLEQITAVAICPSRTYKQKTMAMGELSLAALKELAGEETT